MEPTAFNRFMAGLVGAAAGGLALYIGGHNVATGQFNDTLIFWLPITLALGSLAVFGWWFALRADRPESRVAMRAAWKGGVWVGGIAFVAGYAGPLILTDSNLGPLLGILITGPIGFVVGALGAMLLRSLRVESPDRAG